MPINLNETQNQWLAVNTRDFVLGYHSQAQRGLAALDNETIISVYRYLKRIRTQLQARVAAYTTSELQNAFNATYSGWELDATKWTDFLASYQQAHGTDVPAFLTLCEANAQTITAQSDIGGVNEGTAIYVNPLSAPAQDALRTSLQSALQAIIANYS